MAAHARRSVDGEVDERLEPRPKPADAPAPPTRLDMVLQLQRRAGNQAVQRMLTTSARMVQRAGGDTSFTYGNSGIDVETIDSQEALDEAVEALIEDELDGHRALFTINTVATSVTEWRDFVFGMLDERYDLKDVGKPEVLKSIRALKNTYRGESLQHFAQVHIYWALKDDVPPWDADELKRRMIAKGAYLEPDDDEAIEALQATGGQFAQTEVEYDQAMNVKLVDEDNVVVLIDHHQQKHQFDQIAEFPPYSGGSGSKFAPGKGLDWHRGNTAQVVKAIVQEAVAQRRVTTTKDYNPPKRPKEGITYDLMIRYDEPTGKWVGSYHCNPVRTEH